ncbi:MAG: (Fe-S)-binding protein [Desulfurococcales archaeon]|nr:(Fe-S)-binding protein [Desulfurococcales archaeon]
MYCGFCEPVCPTLPLGRHRGYGPRGRVNLARMVALDGPTDGDYESLYTCLLCAACHTACPARIDIVGVVRAARSLIQQAKRGT